MRYWSSIILALMIGICSAETFAAPVSVKEYTSLRRKYASGISLDTIRSEPSSYQGKYVEIRGRLSGSMRHQAGGGSIIVSTPQGGSFVINTKDIPDDNPGVDIACLATVVGNGDYNMYAWTYDAELDRAEDDAARKAEAKLKTNQAKAQSAKTSAAKQSKSSNKPYNISADEMLRIYTNAVRQFNTKLTDSQARTIAQSILAFSYKYNVDARLVCAVILAESHFKVNATSSAGACGLGQLMPGTAAGLGVKNPYNPIENIYGSTRYIRSMLDRISNGKEWNQLTWNDLALALAAYNAGPGAVKKHGGVPPFKETQNYVRRVTSIYKQLCGIK